jgi:outer membrane biosynthesis protein TonB
MEDLTKSEKSNRRKGLALSITLHVLAIVLASIYGFTIQIPPPEAGGIQVNLGIPDVGQGDENAPPQPEQAEEAPAPEPEEVVEPEPEPVREKPREKTNPTKRETVKTEDPEAARLRKEEEQKKKKEADAARQRQEEEARRRAEEERKRQEEAARQKELEDLVSGGLSGNKGKGKGNTGKPGNQGDPNGDPNASALEGISTGSGMVGGGLGSRGILKRGPVIQDNSQEEGVVMISLCVDKNGSVLGEPEFTQRGSTTADANLIRLAIRNAKQWKFQKGDVDRQCGTIRYEFKLR